MKGGGARGGVAVIEDVGGARGRKGIGGGGDITTGGGRIPMATDIHVNGFRGGTLTFGEINYYNIGPFKHSGVYLL